MDQQWTIDTELGEVLQQNEEQLAREIAAAIAEGIKLQYLPAQRPALRDAHSKAHGCVQADFQVEKDLPPHLAQGVFVPGRNYPALIRFSNGVADPMRPDAKRDARGMAIKLLTVLGDKILPEERDAETQDFIMINHPTFFVDDAARYLALHHVASTNKVVRMVRSAWLLGWKGAFIAFKNTSSKIASPLETRYWSMTAYRLGDPPHKQAIKFSARPCLPATTTIPSHPTRSFLRETMIKQLAAGEARFDFEVQPRTSPAMSVERSMVEWKEADAPFVKVATITIPRQQFATPERDQFGENLSFTPWHALPQHRPLGAVNRMRRVIYQEISKLRHELNGTPRREPSDLDDDKALGRLSREVIAAHEGR